MELTAFTLGVKPRGTLPAFSVDARPAVRLSNVDRRVRIDRFQKRSVLLRVSLDDVGVDRRPEFVRDRFDRTDRFAEPPL